MGIIRYSILVVSQHKQYLILLLLILLIPNILFSQINPYSVEVVDSLTVPYSYNYSKTNQDGSVTFFHVTNINGNINFGAFSLSPEFQFSTEVVFYFEPLTSFAIRGYSNSFGYDYFYVLTSSGSYCYIFNNQSFVSRIESSICFGCYFLPTSANKVIYMDDDYFYRKDIITGTIDTLLISNIEEPTGIWPYSNGRCLIRFIDPNFVFNLILLDNNFCVEDTIHYSNSDDNPVESAIFEPIHATLRQLNGKTIVFSPCIYWGVAITIFNEGNDILYYSPGSSTIYDYVALGQISFANLVNFGEHQQLFGMVKTTILDSVFSENVILDCIPIRLFSYNDSLFILVNVQNQNQAQNQIGISCQNSFPLFNQSQLYIDGFLSWYDVSYWELDNDFFLLAFRTNSSNKIKKFRIIDTTALVDEVETNNAILKYYPNPFHDKLLIHFTDQLKLSDFKIEIFNIKGQHIKSLTCFSQQNLIWDGTDEKNMRVSSGLYLIKINEGNKFISTYKVLLIK